MNNTCFSKIVVIFSMLMITRLHASDRIYVGKVEQCLNGISSVLGRVESGSAEALEVACETANPYLVALAEAQNLRLQTFKTLAKKGPDAFAAMCNGDAACQITSFFEDSQEMSSLYREHLTLLDRLFKDTLMEAVSPQAELFTKNIAVLSHTSFAIARIIWEAILLAYPKNAQAIVSSDKIYGPLFIRLETLLVNIVAASKSHKLSPELIASSLVALPKQELSEFLKLQKKNIQFLMALRMLGKEVKRDRRIINHKFFGVLEDFRDTRKELEARQRAKLSGAAGIEKSDSDKDTDDEDEDEWTNLTASGGGSGWDEEELASE